MSEHAIYSVTEYYGPRIEREWVSSHATLEAAEVALAEIEDNESDGPTILAHNQASGTGYLIGEVERRLDTLDDWGILPNDLEGVMCDDNDIDLDDPESCQAALDRHCADLGYVVVLEGESTDVLVLQPVIEPGGQPQD